MNNFVAKTNINEINKTYSHVYKHQTLVADVAKFLVLEPSGKSLGQYTQDDFFSESRNELSEYKQRLCCKHFWNSGWHLFTSMSIYLITHWVFLERLLWIITVWITIIIKKRLITLTGQEWFLIHCWILVPSAVSGKWKHLKYVWLVDLYCEDLWTWPLYFRKWMWHNWGNTQKKLIIGGQNSIRPAWFCV